MRYKLPCTVKIDGEKYYLSCDTKIETDQEYIIFDYFVRIGNKDFVLVYDRGDFYLEEIEWLSS